MPLKAYHLHRACYHRVLAPWRELRVTLCHCWTERRPINDIYDVIGRGSVIWTNNRAQLTFSYNPHSHDIRDWCLIIVILTVCTFVPRKSYSVRISSSVILKPLLIVRYLIYPCIPEENLTFCSSLDSWYYFRFIPS